MTRGGERGERCGGVEYEYDIGGGDERFALSSPLSPLKSSSSRLLKLLLATQSQLGAEVGGPRAGGLAAPRSIPPRGHSTRSARHRRAPHHTVLSPAHAGDTTLFLATRPHSDLSGVAASHFQPSTMVVAGRERVRWTFRGPLRALQTCLAFPEETSKLQTARLGLRPSSFSPAHARSRALQLWAPREPSGPPE